jgi:6-phosphogluconolactonase (cycloisomerase 2 family)
MASAGGQRALLKGVRMHRLALILIAAFVVGLLVGSAHEAEAKKKGPAFLYIQDNPGTSQIVAFQVDKDGTLTAVPGSPVDLGEDGPGCSSQCYTLAYDPGRKLLFAATNDHIKVFTVGADGALTQFGQAHQTPVRTIGLATVKRGKRLFLYGTEFDNDRVRGYEVQQDGSLVEVPGTPVDTANRPTTLVAAGSRVFVQSDGGVHVFEAANDGSLSEAAGSPFAVATGNTYYLAIDPKGKHVYVPDTSANQVFGFSIASRTGALTPLAGSPFAVAVEPEFGFIAGKKQAFAVDNDEGEGIAVLSRSSKTGALTAQGGAQLASFDELDGIALSPDGKHLATWSGVANTLEVRSVAADGTLTLLDQEPVVLSQFNTSGALFINR